MSAYNVKERYFAFHKVAYHSIKENHALKDVDLGFPIERVASLVNTFTASPIVLLKELTRQLTVLINYLFLKKWKKKTIRFQAAYLRLDE